ncbi:hypothetical protein [Arenimonas caeni]|uniref:Uncharacterized protein n=1 Tax=Arenimonas caeni TaxID=2058085 RepID=A0A2P6MBM2_9GAMM|nr:hypothetical protein [Arenimonas caeni]PRH83398.1 hypothetical protein C6N40_01745 [Arenimonas caeni]
MPLVISIPAISPAEFRLMRVQAHATPAIESFVTAIFRNARASATSKPYPNTKTWMNALQMAKNRRLLTYEINVAPHEALVERAIETTYREYTADAINARPYQARRRSPNYMANKAIRELGYPVVLELAGERWTFNVPEQPSIAGPGYSYEGVICARDLEWYGPERTVRGATCYQAPAPPAAIEGLESLTPHLPRFDHLRAGAKLRLTFRQEDRYFSAQRKHTDRNKMMALVGRFHCSEDGIWTDDRLVQVYVVPLPLQPQLF